MSAPEIYVTPRINELFTPQFVTQDSGAYAVLLKTWQDFAQDSIRWPNVPTQPADMVAFVGFFGQ